MRVRNAFILSTASVAALAIATPAFAQATAPVDTTPEKTVEGEQAPPTSEQTNAEGQVASETPPTETGGAIVVTGSRIRRDNYSTPQNVDILTRDDQILAGTRTTAETLQSATITSGTSQISGSFLGFLAPGGSGANVVGLRGLGTERTLVLLNGRRLAPAGVGPQLVSADLNVLPTTAVQRIEILREGASSIYGSDAIAGVINIITDTAVDGITVDAFADVPLYADDSRTYRLSATAGKTFDRGHIMATFEFTKDQGMTYGSRKDWRCPRELAFVNGHEVGQGSPDDPNKLRCFPFERGSIGTARGYGLGYAAYVLPDDYFGGEDGDTIPDLFKGFRNRLTEGPQFNDITAPPFVVDNFDLRPLTGPAILDNTYLTPLKKYTAYVNGAYELDALGNAELYGEFLFSRRKTEQQGSTQFNPQQNPIGQRQLYGGTILDLDAYFNGDPNYYVDCADSLYGQMNQCSPFFPTSWADAGYNYFGPFIMPDRTFKTSQKVDFWRANAGLRGDLGITDWRYDVNLMVSRTHGKESFYTPLAQPFFDTWNGVAAPAGTPEQFITRALPGQTAPAGTPFTCAANVTGGVYNGNDCVLLNVWDPNILYGGHISQAWYDYTHVTSTSKTKYEQETFNVVFDGSLPFSLPGGTPKMALGFEHRHDKIDDVPSPERQAGTLLFFGSASRTKGSDKVTEGFAEVQLPFLKERPGVDLLEVDASGRWTHYQSYGSQLTYHLAAQYAPIKNIRFRGNYGTNFRAPNLYEQFIADQVGFYSAQLDPCDNFGITQSPGTTLYENCLAELLPILGPDDPATPALEGALGFFGNGSIPVVTQGGRGIIDAETAKTWGLGAVLTAPREFADLSLAVDYWHIRVKGEVANLGNLILNFCYEADDFPNNQYCDLINGRITDPSDPGLGQISSFDNPYLNIAEQIAAGIDFDARYSTGLLGGKFTTQLQATRMLEQKTRFFPGDVLNDFNGEIGYPNAGAGPKWVGSLDTRFTTANDITFRWGIEYVGKAKDHDFNEVLLTENGDVCSPAAGNCLPVHYDLTTEPYWEHGISVQWLWRNVGQITLGVNNLFDQDPPTISLHPDTSGSQPRVGNHLAYGPYDYRGRSFFINVTHSFKPY